MITLPATTSSHKGIALAVEIAERYQLASLQPLIDSTRLLTERNELSVAIIGRFKAGKSGFLNHFLERELLPIGVTPVTTAVTEIGYGERERAVVHFLDGCTNSFQFARFISSLPRRKIQEMKSKSRYLWSICRS